MAKNNIITKRMLTDHGKLVKLLRDFSTKAVSNSGERNNSFNSLKWELERHFITEEKAIFIFYNPVDEEGYLVVPKLLKDHKAIMEYLVLLESELKNEGELNIEKLENLLMTHKKYEEEHFYPKLDQELDDSQKKEIIGRIEEQIYF